MVSDTLIAGVIHLRGKCGIHKGQNYHTLPRSQDSMGAQSLLTLMRSHISQSSILHPPNRHVTHVDEAMSVELPPSF